MTFLAGLLLGSVAGEILGVALMAALAVGGQADRCSECLARQRAIQMAHSGLADGPKAL